MSTEYDINLSDGSVLTTLYALESDGPGNVSTPRLILQSNTGPNTFVLHGDLTFRFVPGFHFEVSQSAGGLNDGVYRTLASVYAIGPNHTTISIDTGPIVPPTTVNNVVDDSPPLGQIFYSIGAASALHLPGKGTVNYGEQVVENLVRMTEHWASDEEPGAYPNGFSAPIVGSPAEVGTPLYGQLWWNNTQEVLFRFTQTSDPLWTSNINMGTGSLFFQDTENPFDPTTQIELTAAGDDVGMSITTLLNPNPLDSILNIYDDDKTTIRFRVEHEGFFGGLNALNVGGSAGGEDSWIDTNLSINRGHSDTMGGAVATPYASVAGVALDVGSGNIRIDDNEGLESVTGARLSSDATGRTFSVRPANAAANRFTVQDNAGVDLLIVDPAGNVGVNRVPTATVDILSTNLTDHLRVDDAADNELFAVSSTGTVRVEVSGGAVDTNFVVDTNTLFVNSTTDFVGINQGTPTSALDVTGDGHFTGRVGINNAVPAGAVFLEVTGDIQFNSQARGSNQSAAAPTYSFINDLTSGMFLNAVGEMSLASGGSEFIRFNTGGGDIQSMAPVDTNGNAVVNRAGTGIDVGVGDTISLGVAAAPSRFQATDNTGTGEGGDLVLRAGKGLGVGLGGSIIVEPGNGKPIDLLRGDPADDVVVRFTDGTDYISLAAPTAGGLGVTRDWTLPIDDPAVVAGNFLTTDAAGNLAFSGMSNAIPIDADGDTGLEVELAADDDTIRLNTGDTPVGFGAVPNILTLSSASFDLNMGTANVAATAGAPVNITAGTGNTTGNGGNIFLNPGQDGGGGLPGQVLLGEDGAATMPALAFVGDEDTGVFRAGTNTVALAAGGTEVLRSTSTFMTLGVAQINGFPDNNLTITMGADVSDNGGNGFIVNASNGGPTSNGGSFIANAGDSGAGGTLGGSGQLRAGDGTVVGGGITISSGNSPGSPGQINLNAGDATAGNGQGGTIILNGGDGFGVGNGGPINIKAGDAGLGGFPSFGGFIGLETGDGGPAGHGDIRISHGPTVTGRIDDNDGDPVPTMRILGAPAPGPASDEGRRIVIEGGTPFPGAGEDGGDVSIIGGEGGIDAGSGGGNIFITGGDVEQFTNGRGGDVSITGSDGDGTADGGDIVITGGDSGDGLGALPGDIDLIAGDAISGSDSAGGDVNLVAGIGSAPSAAYSEAAVATGPGGGFVIGLPADTYDVDVTFDIGGLQQLSIVVTGAESYNAIAGLLNAAVVSGTVSYVNGAFRFTSNTLGVGSSSVVAAGTLGSTGGDLFVAITGATGNAVTFPAPVAGTTGMPGGIVNSVSPHIMSAGTIIPPAAFLEIVPGPKGALALGIGASGLPPGSMTLVIDAAPLPAFVLAAVDPAGTWTRMDTGAVLA